MINLLRVVLAFQLLAFVPSYARAGVDDCPALTVAQLQTLADTHVFGGFPFGGGILVRRGYVAQYDPVRRVPRWVAWRAAPEYRASLPDRSISRWKSFHSDPDLTNPVEGDDYKYWHGSEYNFARGHLAPYFIMGGDRDGDGQTAANAAQQELDIDDACTVYEANFLSNIAPQFHDDFNGPGALWNKLETKIRGLVDGGGTFHIFAGTVFGDAPVQHIGPLTQITMNGAKKTLLKGPFDIAVPHMFFKIVISGQSVIPFLFVHTDKIGSTGCALDAQLEDCIVTTADIEGLTGLDFFSDLGAAHEQQIESSDGAQAWQALTGQMYKRALMVG